MGVWEPWKKEQLALLRGFLKALRGVCLADQRLEEAGQLYTSYTCEYADKQCYPEKMALTSGHKEDC